MRRGERVEGEEGEGKERVKGKERGEGGEGRRQGGEKG